VRPSKSGWDLAKLGLRLVKMGGGTAELGWGLPVAKLG
jgi:hypothetical protein